LEISEIQVCFDAVLWKSVEIQIHNQLKGVAFSVETLMLTRHHSEGAALGAVLIKNLASLRTNQKKVPRVFFENK
jgi:hypothetical protein